jgi:uncharacterized protein YjgD (DUF1641 family)
MTEIATVQHTSRERVESLVDELVGNGDLDNLVHLARLVGSAQDALTDDMVGRLAATVGGGLDMLDRANRSGIAKALPAVAQLVENGDLERLVHLARLAGSAEDALSDDIVGRLAGALGSGLDILDRANRSGVAKALPAVALLVENGDLERIVQLARLVGSAQDTLTDDMIGRLARVACEGILLIDRLTRSDGFLRLIAILEREDVLNTLIEFLDAVSAAREEARKAPPLKGGMGGVMTLVKDRDMQVAMRFIIAVSGYLMPKSDGNPSKKPKVASS